MSDEARDAAVLTSVEREALRGLGQGQVPAVVERIVGARVAAALAPIEALLDDLGRGNGLTYGGVSCGVCSGHSPSWEPHSRNCLNALPDRIRAALAAAVTPGSGEQAGGEG